MFVPCSTLCFGKYPLQQALRTISELEFNKIDVAIHEGGPHLRPSQVAADVHAAAHQLRFVSSLSPTAFSVEIATTHPEELQRQMRALCRLARLCSVPLLSIPAASSGTGIDAEVHRLTGLVHVAGAEGVMLTVETRRGTLAEMPTIAVELCERVNGLGLTLDPSHYIAGQNEGKNYDVVFPHVHHVRLRDTGRGADHFQVRVGLGEIEYGRITSQLARYDYDRALTVAVYDVPDSPFPVEPEVRKLKYLLESLV
ncbi:MAG TPA: sugar phosphate isomerase/epimerase [Gemmataceae bacterium]|nr:sugar phosphate isomerase/epimerase [Gemmataceae bacterium]